MVRTSLCVVVLLFLCIANLGCPPAQVLHPLAPVQIMQPVTVKAAAMNSNGEVEVLKQPVELQTGMWCFWPDDTDVIPNGKDGG
jgi:hypothetical protein